MNNKECGICHGMRWDNGVVDGTTCHKCGARYVCWNNGPAEWLKHPAVRACENLERMGRGHFLTIEKKLRRIDRLLAALTKKPKRKPAAAKGAGRG